MKPSHLLHRAFHIMVVVVVTGALACGDMATPPASIPNPGATSLPDNPQTDAIASLKMDPRSSRSLRAAGFLTSAGCQPVDRPDTGAVVLRLGATSVRFFDCSGAERASWRRGYRAAVLELVSAYRGAFLMTGYWEYHVVEVRATCTNFIGTVGFSFPTAGTSELFSAPDGESLGWFSFEANVPFMIDVYYQFPCTELVFAPGTWVPLDGGDDPPPDGGDGGGGGGGDVPPAPPPVDSLPVDSLPVNRFEPDELYMPTDTINCQLPQANDDAAAWCTGRPLSNRPASYRTRLDAANERMRAKGGICSTFAATIDSVLARDAIHTSFDFIHSAWSSTGLGGMGAILLREEYFRNFYDFAHKGRIGQQLVTLQLVLAHEAEHLVTGESAHVDTDGTLMLHTLACSDLDPD